MTTKDKNTYFKITISPYDEYWIVEKTTLETNVADWVEEYGKLRVSVVKMTEKEFNKLPEY